MQYRTDSDDLLFDERSEGSIIANIRIHKLFTRNFIRRMAEINRLRLTGVYTYTTLMPIINGVDRDDLDPINWTSHSVTFDKWLASLNCMFHKYGGERGVRAVLSLTNDQIRERYNDGKAIGDIVFGEFYF